MSKELFDHVVTITEELLGPAAQRFVSRQVSAHLGKTPDEITPEDLPKLIEWTRVSLAMLTNDSEAIENYVQKVSALKQVVPR
jgi:hypothetical protein